MWKQVTVDKSGKRAKRKVNTKLKRWRRKSVPYLNELIEQYGADILTAPKFREQDEYIQHGNITVRQHCMSVARASLKLDSLLHARCNERALIRGALLHDYFLYDWHNHEQSPSWHGFKHARIALQNASEDFSLNILEEEIIKKHMWPLNVSPPRCREAWIVNLADTYCSLLETIHVHKNKL